jgi:hypothetical protein
MNWDIMEFMGMALLGSHCRGAARLPIAPVDDSFLIFRWHEYVQPVGQMKL